MAVFAPMPSASVATAVAVKVLFLTNVRSAYRTSPRISSSSRSPALARASSLYCSIEPNSVRARRAASSRAMPRRTRSAARASTWNRISSLMSSSNAERFPAARRNEKILRMMSPQPSEGRALSADAIAVARRFQLSICSRRRRRPAAVRL